MGSMERHGVLQLAELGSCCSLILIGFIFIRQPVLHHIKRKFLSGYFQKMLGDEMNTSQFFLLCLCGAFFLVVALIAAIGDHYSLKGIQRKFAVLPTPDAPIINVWISASSTSAGLATILPAAEETLVQRAEQKETSEESPSDKPQFSQAMSM